MEDGRIDENMLALSIGLTTTGVYGLARAVNSEQWYRNIILHDSLYSCEQLLEFVYPELAKQNSWKLPVWYYISKSNMKSELAEEKAPHSYTEIVTESTIKRNRSAIGERTAWEVWTQEKDNLMKAIRLLGCMPEEKIDVNQYQDILGRKSMEKLANTNLRMVSQAYALPKMITFLEMFDVGRIEHLVSANRWKENNPVKSLATPIGISTDGSLFCLDLHEKYQGPHGLVAGMTGSGKSEFIITYILSLAVNYHPNDVSMILIDYKGGGLAGAFQKGDVKLPHIVGTITNIDKAGLQRSLVSIQSELRRRQVKFNQAREKTDEGTIDIYKYQKLYHDGIVKEPIPHLLIICDEFAELKQQQPDFMDELISVARIGRSLGVHLILATQKPAGVVNDQIRSNSRFGICLKVQDRQDSIDVIKRPDAADLKRVGQFYIQVGNNEYFALGQSAWAGASYEPSDIIKKKVDTSMKFVSNIGSVIKKVDDTLKSPTRKDGEQLTNIVKYIYQLGKHENIKLKPLWLDNIPNVIMLDNIKKKYNIQKKENEVIPVVGEYDDPYNQRQGPVEIDFKKQGNVIVYGNAESGKETFISTMVYDIISTYSVKEAQMYLIDFGSEALKIFKDAPHIGDVVLSTDTEKINRLFEILQREMKRRTEILSNYDGDIKLYINDTGAEMPQVFIIINNFKI